MESLHLPSSYILIHAAFPLPGSHSRSTFTQKIAVMNGNLLSKLRPIRTLFISSSAVYSLEGDKVDPWEIYGTLKLKTECDFGENLPNVTVFRPGTLIDETRTSSMITFLSQLRSSRFPIFPGEGQFHHPFTYTPDLVSAIVQWALSECNSGVFDLIAPGSMSFREICYLARKVPVTKEIRIPIGGLNALGFDHFPVFGISRWHFRALTYDLKTTSTNEFCQYFINYEEIFSRCVIP